MTNSSSHHGNLVAWHRTQSAEARQKLFVLAAALERAEDAEAQQLAQEMEAWQERLSDSLYEISRLTHKVEGEDK